MSYKTYNYRTRLKRDTSSNWTANDPLLLDGEMILVDTAEGELRIKIGDGKKTYKQLPFEDEILRNFIENKISSLNARIGHILGESSATIIKRW